MEEKKRLLNKTNSMQTLADSPSLKAGRLPGQQEPDSVMKRFDLFPKLDDTYKQMTRHGAYMTRLASLVLLWLFLSELWSYMSLKHSYEFIVDPVVDSKLQVSLDVTVAMPCQYLNIDALDMTGSSLHLRHEFHSIAVPSHSWSLNPHIYQEYHHKDAMRSGSSSSHGFRSAGGALNDGDSSSNAESNIRNMVKGARFLRAMDSEAAHVVVPRITAADVSGNGSELRESCRIYGSVNVNKVSSNVHITAVGRGYVGPVTPVEQLNFTHSIDRLQFGLFYPGLVNPVDFTYQVAEKPFTSFSYFISVVPTIYIDYFGNQIMTTQYAVTENTKSFGENDRGYPGVFIRYDLEPISVRVSETSQSSFLWFLMRVFASIGGFWRIFAWTDGLIGIATAWLR